MNAHSPAPVVGLGLYPLPDAARLAQLDLTTARRWAEGYNYRYRGEQRRSPAVMELTLPRTAAGRDLTFPELLTLRLVKGFRGAGLGLRTIKRVAEVAAREYGTPLPFVTTRFRTGGRRVFIELRPFCARAGGATWPCSSRRARCCGGGRRSCSRPRRVRRAPHGECRRSWAGVAYSGCFRAPATAAERAHRQPLERFQVVCPYPQLAR
jgi:hypothetical protein